MRRVAIWIVLWGGLLAGTLYADRHKVSQDLADKLGQPDAFVDIVVRYNGDPSDAELAGWTAKGAKLKDHMTHLRTVTFQAPAGLIDTLSDNPNVAYISIDRPVMAQFDYAEQTVNAPVAWAQGLDGSGVGIALIDSGVASNDDLEQADSHKSRVIYREALNGLKGDEYGHGTHVAGILAGNGKSSTGPGFKYTFKGVAPNANLIDLEVMDDQGMTTDSLVIKAIDRAIDLKEKYNIRIINLSLGRPIYESSDTDPLCRAVADAWKAGLVVVVSAGNLGRNSYASILSPANSPYAITVGAMKTMGTPARGDDLIASYSSKGPTYIDMTVKPDLVAPGNLMTSLLAPGSALVRDYPEGIVPISSYSSFNGGKPAYYTLSGTSMATPIVSGAATLMIQKDSQITPDTVKARLMKSATKDFPATSVAVDPATGIAYVSQYDIFTIGAGYLDIMGALANNDVADAGSQSPGVFYDAASGNFYLIQDDTAVWGTSRTAVWGTTAVWGSTAVWGNSRTAVWGTTAVWGSSAIWGTSAMWGTSAVWGNSKTAVWGTGKTAVWGTGKTAVWGTCIPLTGEGK